ncbi:MAG: hypothetical protein AAF635_12580 [Cyanobacteria bacterium P01_C01_bin.69]
MESIVANRKRFPISLPPWHEKRLIWWAYLKGDSKTGLAQNSLQETIEENDESIQAGLEELAQDEGISVEELKARILEGTI